MAVMNSVLTDSIHAPCLVLWGTMSSMLAGTHGVTFAIHAALVGVAASYGAVCFLA